MKKIVRVCIFLLIISLLATISFASDIKISDGTSTYAVTFDEESAYFVLVPNGTDSIHILQDSNVPILVYNNDMYGLASPDGEEMFNDWGLTETGNYDSNSNAFVLPINAFDDSSDYDGYTKSIYLIADTDGTQYTLYVGFSNGENSAPTFAKESYASTTLYLGKGQTVSFSLSGLFMDADGDSLTYKYSATLSGEYASCSGTSYSITGSTESTTLYFKANDGKTDSEDVFTVTVVPVDKVALTSALEDAKLVAQDDYYSSADYYNGNIYQANKVGFWDTFTAAKSRAEIAKTSTNFSQESINSVAAELTRAQTNLISKSALNTTPLYEALQQVNGLGYNDLSLKEYTETSAAKFKAGRDEMQAYLDSLFTGKTNERTPSATNKNENQAVLNAAVATTKNLPTLLVHQSLVSYSEQNTKTIQALAARYGAGENPGYTEESWSALQSARTGALTYVKAHPVTDKLTKDEERGLREKANTALERNLRAQVRRRADPRHADLYGRLSSSRPVQQAGRHERLDARL